MSNLALIEAARNSDLARVDSLIQNGADVNQQDEQGWTPLNFAAGKGDLEIVKLLVKSGADVFKAGRDMRTPYMIALAAGRVTVVKYLREVEAVSTGVPPVRPERKYCKAYQLGDLRPYPAWRESRSNSKDQESRSEGASADSFSDDRIVYIHQDFTVTESMWPNENVLFDRVDSNWQEFCANTLKFKVPDDLDLIASVENVTEIEAS